MNRFSPMHLRGPVRLGQPPRREVGATDVAHLALAHEVVQRAQRFLDRGARIETVDLIQVDPVGAQAAQTVLDGGHDVAAGAALFHADVVHRIAELGGQDDVFAAVAEHLTHRGFGTATLAIGVGGVEQSDAEIDGFVDDGAGRLEVDAAAEIVAAEADGGHEQAGRAQISDFHRLCSSVRPPANHVKRWLGCP